MNEVVLVIAPHPDDETLGCGGTLLSLKEKGCKIFWLIVTDIKDVHENKAIKENRDIEINLVAQKYKFDQVIKLGVNSTEVDLEPRGNLIQKIASILNQVMPNILFIPFKNDVHSDHKIIAEATISCTKWFRHSYLNKIFYYETISETDFNIDSTEIGFKPNVYIDISNFLEKKIDIMKTYKSEMLEFPFPRSEKAIRSLANYRGSQSGFEASEAFELLRANIRII